VITLRKKKPVLAGIHPAMASWLRRAGLPAGVVAIRQVDREEADYRGAINRQFKRRIVSTACACRK